MNILTFPGPSERAVRESAKRYGQLPTAVAALRSGSSPAAALYMARDKGVRSGTYRPNDPTPPQAS